MKCPLCQAKLLPVAGEMFCLQCGNAVPAKPGEPIDELVLEETTDPLLQKAIVDAKQHEVHFRLPVSGVTPKPKTAAFTTMRQVLAPPRLVSAASNATGGGVVQAVMAGAVSVMPTAAAGAVLGTPAHDDPAPIVADDLAESAVIKPAKSGSDALNLLPEPVAAGLGRRSFWSHISSAWLVGLGVFAVFLAINGLLLAYYGGRVYPGVRVGTVALGGVQLNELRAKLVRDVPSASDLKLQIGTNAITLPASAIGQPDWERLEREVQAVGRTTPLPLAGVIWSWFSEPVGPQYVVQDQKLKDAVAAGLRNVNYQASEAVPMVLAGKVIMITQKTGSKIEPTKVEQAVRGAFGSQATLVLTADKLEPLVTSDAYKQSIAQAQQKLGLVLEVKVKSATYRPNASQIGEWLVFKPAGAGLIVDSAGVSSYVAGLPGKFDRAAAATALIGALEANTNLSHVASTKKNVAAPKFASAAAALPMRAYSYCVEAPTVDLALALGDRAAEALRGAQGWSLGGRLAFNEAASGCNFTLELMKSSDMTALNAACNGQTTCQVGNRLAFSTDAWSKAPTDWKGTLDGYRSELITHETGHWLGFDHPVCKTAVTPILEAPTVVLGGCSPNWYAVPAELQGAKVLAGF